MKTHEAVRHMSKLVIAIFQDAARKPVRSPGDIVFAAYRLGCDVHFVTKGETSYATRRDGGEPQGKIAINPAWPREQIKRHLAHETSHHTIIWWHKWGVCIPPDVQEALERLTPDDAEERICRDVALLICDTIHLEANGKLALPPRKFPMSYRRWRRIPTRCAQETSKTE